VVKLKYSLCWNRWSNLSIVLVGIDGNIGVVISPKGNNGDLRVSYHSLNMFYIVSTTKKPIHQCFLWWGLV